MKEYGRAKNEAASEDRPRLEEIPDALGAAVRLATGAGEFDENTGEPLDSDAELEVLATRAGEAWESLLDGAKAAVLTAYKDHLLFDASRNFSYDGLEDAEYGNYYEGRYKGVREALAGLGFAVDAEEIERKGREELFAEVERGLPEKRRLAAERPGVYRLQGEVEEAEAALEALRERMGQDDR